MRVLVSGATGFLGRALVLRLQRDGHSVCAWVRSPKSARSLLGADVALLGMAASDRALAQALGECDAVVNLAGAPIAWPRWSRRRKRTLRASRVGVTERLVDALAGQTRPRVLVSASAVGWYGDRGDEELDEESAAGDGFLAELCGAWEEAAQRAEQHGLRVVRLRTGVVLGRGGGALAKLLPMIRAGLGGRLGTGRQYVPWIHLHDLVAIIATALVDERLRGAVNATAPAPVTNGELVAALARSAHRPAFFAVPRLALRLVLGEAAIVPLSSQRAIPRRLQASGFRFRFPRLDEALADVTGGADVTIAPLAAASARPEGSATYLATRRPRYLLQSASTVHAPIADVFAFFSRPENLGLMTPAEMGFRITSAPQAMMNGARIDYRIRVGPLGLGWRTRIENWQPGRSFVDSQQVGPYRAWWHEHRFRADGERTVMEDRVYYAPPLGWLGRIVNSLFVAPALRRIFRYRADAIRLRFGTSRDPQLAS